MFDHFSGFSEHSRRAGAQGWARGVSLTGQDVLSAVRAAAAPGRSARPADKRIARLHCLFMPAGARLSSLAPIKFPMRAAGPHRMLRPAAAFLAVANSPRMHSRFAGFGLAATSANAVAGGRHPVRIYVPAPSMAPAGRARAFAPMAPGFAGLAATGEARSAVRGRSFAPPVHSSRPVRSPAAAAEIPKAWRGQDADVAAPRRLLTPGSEGPGRSPVRPVLEAEQECGAGADIAEQILPPSFDIGRALEAYFFRQSRLPPSGAAAFDPRITPAWTGLGLI